MKRKLFFTIWYSITFLCCLFSITMIFITKGRHYSLLLAAAVLCILQALGLLYFLTTREKKSWLSALMQINFLISIFTFVLALATFVMMSSQFHAEIKADAKGDASKINMKMVSKSENSYVYQTKDMYIIFPQYESVEFAIKDRPSKTDQKITYCGGAAMTSAFKLSFENNIIMGDYVHKGKFYRGADLAAYCGAFTFYNGKAKLTTKGNTTKELLKAAQNGGEGFEEHIALSDNEIIPLSVQEFGCVRVLAEFKDKICIIDSIKPMYFNDFVRELKAMGVKNALYEDMGAGWNYSWYRDNSGKAINLFGPPFVFSHNWIVFRK